MTRTQRFAFAAMFAGVLVAATFEWAVRSMFCDLTN